MEDCVFGCGEGKLCTNTALACLWVVLLYYFDDWIKTGLRVVVEDPGRNISQRRAKARLVSS